MPTCRAVRALLLLLAAATCACPRTAEDSGGPVAVFGPVGASVPVPFMQYPFPIDLARTGNTVRTSLPDFQEERADTDIPMNELMQTGLAERAGFSGTAAVMFAFDAPLDPSTVTGGNVVLVGLEGPDAGKDIPARVGYRDDVRRVFVSPAYGHRLLGGSTYGAFVTTGVKGVDGRAVRSSPEFRSALPVPSRTLLPVPGSAGVQSPAVAMFAPLQELLRARGVANEDVAVATVFTVDQPEQQVAALRDAVLAEPLPTLERVGMFPRTGYDLDRLFGIAADNEPGINNGAIAHQFIRYVIHARFRSPLFIHEQPGKNGVMAWDASGNPLRKGYDDIPVSIILPMGTVDPARMPLVIYLHGLGGQRADGFAVANELCRRGYAVAAWELPFHGSRAAPLPARDQENNITGEAYPDGIGDFTGQSVFTSFGITSDSADVPPMAPMIVRDSLRQGFADGFAVVRVLLDGDKAPLVDGVDGFAGLDFDEARVFWESESFGSIHGVPIVAMEPRIRAAVFSVGGGGLVVDTLFNSPSYGPPFSLFIYPRLGLSGSLADDLTINYVDRPPAHEFALQLFQSVVDAADPVAYAPLLARFPRGGSARSMLFLAPFSDESVPNQAQESLAQAAGAVALRNGEAPDQRHGSMDVVDGPVTGNVNGAAVAFIQFKPATHGLITRRREVNKYEPGFPPFVKRVPEVVTENPTGSAQRTAADFLDSVGAGAATISVVP